MRNKNAMYKKKSLFIICLVLAISVMVYLAMIKVGCLRDMMSTQIANISEFKLKRLEITGASPKVMKIIRSHIRSCEGNSIFNTSKDEIYNHITNISWVKSALVKKRLPNIIAIKITEAVPIAVYQHNAKSILIDSDGQYLEEVTAKPVGLPLVSGKNANKMVSQMLSIISKFSDIKERLEILKYVRERRWDIAVSGVKIKLPENNVEKALELLNCFIKDDRTSINDINIIDLRINGQITINSLKSKIQ